MGKQKVKDGFFDPSKDWTPFPAHEKERERVGFFEETPTIKSVENMKKIEQSMNDYIEFKKGLPYINNDNDLLI